MTGTTSPGSAPEALTGRLSGPVAALLAEEVLEPQFHYELAHLLSWYVRIEKALVIEYRRMDLVDQTEASHLATALDIAQTLVPDRTANFADIAFALEKFVEARLPEPIPTWHIDRSRNDLQATAQLLAARDQVRQTVDTMLGCAEAAHRLAGDWTETPVPGYTHGQPAQVITPAFFLTALIEHFLGAVGRLAHAYDGLRSPLGAGAMAGQELPWDRDALAQLLGFTGPERHALVGVASRCWAMHLTAECSTFGVGLSRFVTDLMAWTSGAHRFADLPDELAGISSAMPQKKNFPILERIRGRLAHLSSAYVDLAFTQRGTAFSNTVETAKEGGSRLMPMFADLRSALRLLTAVLEGIEFDRERMRAACAAEFLGGFSLATSLSLRAGVPWRTAQVLAGRYVTATLADGGGPADVDGDRLRAVTEAAGFTVPDAEDLLCAAFDPDRDLRRRASAGGSAPSAVRTLLRAQSTDLGSHRIEWARRAERQEAASTRLDLLLTAAAPGGPV